MIIYFTTNDRWYSRLARWLENGDATHVGIGFWFPKSGREMVIDISRPCGSIYPSEIWINKYRVVNAIFLPSASCEESGEIMQKVWNYCVGREYDMKSYKFFILRGILRRLGLPHMFKHKMADKDKGVCTNIFDPIRTYLTSRGYDFTDADFSSETPQMIMDKFLDMKKKKQPIF